MANLKNSLRFLNELCFTLAITMICVPVMTFSQSNTHDIKNLVFEGGGIRGIAYAGALKALEKHEALDKIENVAGTSVGAIIAALIAVGYTADEIERIVLETDFQKFADGKFIFIGGFRRIFKKYGWYRGEKLRKWLEKMIETKTGNSTYTFEDLHNSSNKEFKNLFVVATNLSKQKATVFSFDNYPKMEIRNAVRASLSIPMYFQAVKLDSAGNISRNKNDDIYIDGGFILNFPIHIFDNQNNMNPETIGLRLDRSEQIIYDEMQMGIAPYVIKNFKNYIEAFYNLSIEYLNKQSLSQQDWERTISINTLDFGPKIKKLSLQEKEMLIKSGEKAVETYFLNHKQ